MIDEEDAGEEFYCYYSATLRIFGAIPDLDEISKRLGLVPTHTHRNGERRGPRHRGYEHDMWSYQPNLHATRLLEEHIRALWESIRSEVDYLISLKRALTVDVFCGYRSNCPTAGFQVSHQCLELFTRLEVPFGVSVVVA